MSAGGEEPAAAAASAALSKEEEAGEVIERRAAAAKKKSSFANLSWSGWGWRERQGRGRIQPASQSTSLFRSCGRDRAEDSAAPSVLQRHFKPELQICSFISFMQRQRQEGRGLKWRQRFTLGCLPPRVGLCYLLFSKTLRPALPVIFPARTARAVQSAEGTAVSLRCPRQRPPSASGTFAGFGVRPSSSLLCLARGLPCLSLQPLPVRSLLSAFSARGEQI